MLIRTVGQSWGLRVPPEPVWNQTHGHSADWRPDIVTNGCSSYDTVGKSTPKWNITSTQRPLSATKQMVRFISVWSPLALTVWGNSCEQENSNKVKLQTIMRKKWTQEEKSSAPIVRVVVNGWNLHWKKDLSGVDNARLDGEAIPIFASLQRFSFWLL